MSADQRNTLYTDVSEKTASLVIKSYSTSFAMACQLLKPPVRQHVENIYGYVRIADEIVDGAATENGLTARQIATILDQFEADTYAALKLNYSPNPIIHAFVRTANRVGFGKNLIEPFLASMRADIKQIAHTQESFDTYVYGSAEVIGLMCLQAFIEDHNVTAAERKTLVKGARALGAAFQKVNFLRDLAADFKVLGRSYFPGVTVEQFSDDEKARLIADIRSDLAASAKTLPMLPKSSRRAVTLAQSLFEELTDRIEQTPASELLNTRISVPASVKARLAASAALGRGVTS